MKHTKFKIYCILIRVYNHKIILKFASFFLKSNKKLIDTWDLFNILSSIAKAKWLSAVFFSFMRCDLYSIILNFEESTIDAGERRLVLQRV